MAHVPISDIDYRGAKLKVRWSYNAVRALLKGRRHKWRSITKSFKKAVEMKDYWYALPPEERNVKLNGKSSKSEGTTKASGKRKHRKQVLDKMTFLNIKLWNRIFIRRLLIRVIPKTTTEVPNEKHGNNWQMKVELEKIKNVRTEATTKIWTTVRNSLETFC